MKDPKRCISYNCQHRHECEYAAIDDRVREFFLDGIPADRVAPTIHPVAMVCKRYVDNPRYTTS